MLVEFDSYLNYDWLEQIGQWLQVQFVIKLIFRQLTKYMGHKLIISIKISIYWSYSFRASSLFMLLKIYNEKMIS